MEANGHSDMAIPFQYASGDGLQNDGDGYQVAMIQEHLSNPPSEQQAQNQPLAHPVLGADGGKIEMSDSFVAWLISSE